MKVDDKKLVAAFVVPVLIIAGVVGYQLYREEEIPIEVDEGFAEMTVEYQPPWGWIYQLESTATTNINDNSKLEFDVVVLDVTKKSSGHNIYMEFGVYGHFEDELSPKTLEFRARGLDEANVSFNDYYIFTPKRGTYEGCDLWDRGYSSYGRGTDTAVVGLNIEKNNFSARGAELEWRIPPSNFGNPYTLEIQAVVGGLSEEVIATVHVHIDLFSKIESLEASIDKEHYLTSDYPSEESRHWVYPEITYKFENLPGGEDVLYDVEIYAFSSDYYYFEDYEGLFLYEVNLTSGTWYDATLNLLFYERHAEMGVMEFELRFVITSQEGNWVYDSMEDDNFHLTFTVTHDGGGDK